MSTKDGMLEPKEAPFTIHVNGVKRWTLQTAAQAAIYWRGLNLGMGYRATIRNNSGQLIASRRGL